MWTFRRTGSHGPDSALAVLRSSSGAWAPISSRALRGQNPTSCVPDPTSVHTAQMPDPEIQPQTDPLAPAPRWPGGWALPVIESAATTTATRVALLARMTGSRPHSPQCLAPDAYETFAAACARLVPSTDLALAVDVAPAIDARLAAGTGDGWRYATLPPDAEAFRRGVALLDAAAAAGFAERFCDLAPAGQDAILRDAQHARGAFAGGFDARRWFADWLAEAAGLFYAHPLAQQDIGYAGFSDAGPPGAPGWTAIGLGEREPREPEPIRPVLPAASASAAP